MLYCKNATQQKLPLTLDPRVLYRGIGVSVGNMVLITGAQFPLTGMVSRALTGGVDRSLDKSEKIAAGFAGGAISGLICAPMELIMIQQQRKGTAMLSAAANIVRERGVLTLFRGLETSCGREGLFTAGYLGMGPVFAEQLQRRYDMSASSANFAGAAGAGMIAATLSHPLDTIKCVLRASITDAFGRPAPGARAAPSAFTHALPADGVCRACGPQDMHARRHRAGHVHRLCRHRAHATAAGGHRPLLQRLGFPYVAHDLRHLAHWPV